MEGIPFQYLEFKPITVQNEDLQFQRNATIKENHTLKSMKIVCGHTLLKELGLKRDHKYYHPSPTAHLL